MVRRRELLLHHRDPYGAEVSREIQVAYYGHALDTAARITGGTSSASRTRCMCFFSWPQLSNYIPGSSGRRARDLGFAGRSQRIAVAPGFGMAAATLVKLALVVLT